MFKEQRTKELKAQRARTLTAFEINQIFTSSPHQSASGCAQGQVGDFHELAFRQTFAADRLANKRCALLALGGGDQCFSC